VSVGGTISAQDDNEPGTVTVDQVEVQLGSGVFRRGDFDDVNFTWGFSGVAPELGGAPLAIRARVKGEFKHAGNNPPPPQSLQSSDAVTVKRAPPELTIEPFATDVVAPSLPYKLALRGAARDVPSGVASVQFRVGDNGAFANVDNSSGDWAQWAKVIDLPAGQSHLTVNATDKLGNSLSQSFTVVVSNPFEPTAIDQVFEPTTYLRELLDFTKNQIKIGGTDTGPTPVVLAKRFLQPFDQLTVAKAYDQAVLPVHPARIAVEVLRQQMHPADTPAIVQSFRSAAYEALLRELGTSHQDLRLARVADGATRRAVAARIGIEIEDTRPDRLDQMTFLPDSVTGAQLEQLFGYQAYAPIDMLQPPAGDPTFLLWRLAALRNAWQRDDARTRDIASSSLPIIDPDLIDNANIKTHQASNPSFALWTARKSWIDTTLTAIRHEGETQTNPLARFDQVVLKFVGTIDLTALAGRDANGEDVSVDLGPFHLDLDAFVFLAQCRQLLAAGTLLDSEWQDIFAILLQTQKKAEYQQWRGEERQAGVILEPSQFLADAGGMTPEIPQWRGDSQTFSDWRRTLLARAAQEQTLRTSYQAALDTAEAQTLPALRDALIEVIGQQHQPNPEDLNTAAERLTRELLIDARANTGVKTTRVEQALETLQGILFSVRSGRLATGADGVWSLNDGAAFDAEWSWMGNYDTWLAAIRVFAYPENQLFPELYVHDVSLPTAPLAPTQAFLDMIRDLRQAYSLTPESARSEASKYLEDLRKELGAALPADLKAPTFAITDQIPNLASRQQLVTNVFGSVNTVKDIPPYLREVFWLVPMALALRLQKERHYLAALDWFRTVYAYDSPPANRKIYLGLALEETIIPPTAIASAYERVPNWLIVQLNPHVIAYKRNNAYTRFTVMSIVRCFLAYADTEFSRNTAEAITRARTLYQTSSDLLGLPDLQPETGPEIPFPTNPVWDSLRVQARSNLQKIHNGMNIAGVRTVVPLANGPATMFLPSQYRYAVLVERAKNLVGIAQQVESAFLSALEKRDAEAYSMLQANNDFQVAQSSKVVADLKVTDANIGKASAQLQQEKAADQFDYYDQQIRNGLNGYEKGALAEMGLSAAIHAGAIFTPDGASQAAEAASETATLLQTWASFERRNEEWQLQKNLAAKDKQLSDQENDHAQNQQQVAVQEQQLAQSQLAHAGAVLDFLATKFTNVELFDWMSGVLGGIYAYFLQQSTALAQLAQAQLAFERQEPAPGFIQSDYWQDTLDNSGTSDPVDRRGMTGSARLLQDISQLDQYAFDTDRRKLHLTQTLSLAEIAALELQQFRDTGLLVFSTPMEIFDREFPGHYLRLVKRVRVSLIALVPPQRGVRATLSASGLSRVIVAGDQFVPVVLNRAPEAIAFTSPSNASGMFDLEPDNGLLLPFEGMGVDAVWQLEMPKPANPFDYRTIADVLLTIEYTALNSYDYRQQVLRGQDASFGGDRAFSVKDEFPDAWYDLNNPGTVADAASRMHATLTTQRGDFPPHLTELAVQQISLFCLRQDGFTQELNIKSLGFTAPGSQTVTAPEVRTTGGIIGTRRPAGAAWEVLVGHDPVGEWSIQLEDTDTVRGWFKNGSILDIVLVLTISGVTPAWP
jgi:hypothetical protein